LKAGLESPFLESVYFWWGTPSTLRISQIKKILDTLKEVYTFSDTIEITFETTPQNISLENLQNWRSLWINRISTWIQSLNEKALKEVWRITKKEIFEKLDILRTSPIENVAVDFIIGLPYTIPWELGESIGYILEAYPFIKHISVYMLEEYTYPKNWQEHAFPKEAFQDEYANIKNILEKHWLQRYELSNFSIPWFECKHNKAYWNHSEVAAFWLGSYGFEDGIRYSYGEKFKDYYSWKGYSEDILDEEAVRIEKIMFWIRTNGIQEWLIGDDKKEKLNYYIWEKYLAKEGNMIYISEKWVPLMDAILSEII
jgi:oxygen-independent coproporphyrinogen III oxidase